MVALDHDPYSVQFRLKTCTLNRKKHWQCVIDGLRLNVVKPWLFTFSSIEEANDKNTSYGGSGPWSLFGLVSVEEVYIKQNKIMTVCSNKWTAVKCCKTAIVYIFQHRRNKTTKKTSNGGYGPWSHVKQNKIMTVCDKRTEVKCKTAIV